jgi:hypothetical protein
MAVLIVLAAMPRQSKTDWKSLWAILWRVLLFGPILGVLGLALLLLVIGAFVAPPIYAAFAFFSGDWFLGIAALAAWAVVLRFRRSILRWTLEGIEYASI